MAFKSIKKIEQDRYGKFIRLDDGKSLNGVFIYNSYDDVLVANAHYINTKEYTGYVHCCEDGCPACRKGIKLQNKLFIPFFVLAELNPDYDTDTILFWDRNTGFNHQLRKDVFDNYPNPAGIIFNITRHGAYRDINTTYSITPKLNFSSDLNEILDSLGVSFPDYYENVIRTVDAVTLDEWLNESGSKTESSFNPVATYSYQAKPRKRMPDPEDISESDEQLPGNEVEDVTSSTVHNDLPQYIPGQTVIDDESDDSNETETHVDSIPDVENDDFIDSDDDDCEPTF